MSPLKYLLLLPLMAGYLFGGPNTVDAEWQLRIGDDPQWASPDYPVGGWTTYNLGISGERQHLGGETAWLRKSFRIPSAWKGRALRCNVRIQASAVQLYLNGGRLSPVFDDTQSASFLLPEASLRLDGENHLAIRLSGHAYTGGLSQDHLEVFPNDGAAPCLTLSLDYPTPDHVFASGTAIGLQVSALVEGEAAPSGRMRLQVVNEFHKPVFIQEQPSSLVSGRNVRAFSIPSLPPGFYQSVISFSAAGFEAQQVSWFAVAPTEISCHPTPPADFDEFWKRAKAELASVEPEYRIAPEPSRGTARHRVFTVSMKSVGGVTVRAWYVMPRKEGRYPAVLHLPGYSASFQPESLMSDDDVIHLGLDIRGHGRSADVVNPGFGYPGFVGSMLHDPEAYVYRGAYLDALRGLDFLCSRPEVDSSRIAVTGGSQGGGLAIAATALSDGRVRCCEVAVPFLGDFMHHQQIRAVYIAELEGSLKALGKTDYSIVRRTMSYVDTVNFAPSIKCPVQMVSGLFDDDCPPHIGFAMFNNLAGLKEYVILPDCSHNVWGNNRWENVARPWIRQQLGVAP